MFVLPKGEDVEFPKGEEFGAVLPDAASAPVEGGFAALGADESILNEKPPAGGKDEVGVLDVGAVALVLLIPVFVDSVVPPADVPN